MNIQVEQTLSLTNWCSQILKKNYKNVNTCKGTISLFKKKFRCSVAHNRILYITEI